MSMPLNTPNISEKTISKVYIESFGCQMNDQDMARMLTLVKGDYSRTDEPDNADLILVNTCSIRDKAEQKLYSTVGRFKSLKEANKGLLIGITGCVAQQEGEGLLKRMPYVDMVIGTQNLQKLPAIIDDLTQKRVDKAVYIDRYKEIQEDEFETVPYSENPYKAHLTIMRGCDKVCTFCIVPRVRGREVCRKSSDILDEVFVLRDRGIKEITLLGQTVTSYSPLTGGDSTFAELINKVAEVEGIERVRFTSPHPIDFINSGSELISVLAEERKICSSIHMPLQSGSNAVLKAMKRGYTIEEYLDSVNTLKKAYEARGRHYAITTDMIVGFPGETDKDFEDTMKALEDVRFDGMYSFIFSPRPKTAAAGYTDGMVEKSVASERLSKLQARHKEISFEKSALLEGTTQEILVEGESRNNPDEDNILMGRTECNRIVNFKGEASMEGSLKKVKVTKVFKNSLWGELCGVTPSGGEPCLS